MHDQDYLVKTSGARRRQDLLPGGPALASGERIPIDGAPSPLIRSEIMAEDDETQALVSSIKAALGTLEKTEWDVLAGPDLQKALRLDLRYWIEPTIAFA